MALVPIGLPAPAASLLTGISQGGSSSSSRCSWQGLHPPLRTGLLTGLTACGAVATLRLQWRGWQRPALASRGAGSFTRERRRDRRRQDFSSNGPPQRTRGRPDKPKELVRQQRKVQVPEGWGKRADGLKQPWKYKWYRDAQRKAEALEAEMGTPLRSLDREPIRDFGEMLEAGIAPASQDHLDQMLGDDELIHMRRRRRQAKTPKDHERIMLELKQSVPEEDRPALFPHFRKAHDWGTSSSSSDPADGSQAKRNDAGKFFFSKKAWSEVFGTNSDITSLAQQMALPRPSRIQNLTFYDIVNGKNVLIAEQAGSGKTLAYLLPLLQRHVLSTPDTDSSVKLIIVAPTSDLAKQIADVARVSSARSRRKFSVLDFCGGGDLGFQNRRLKRGVDVVVATPGRLRFLMSEENLADKDCWNSVRAVVFDEVDVLLLPDADIKLAELRLQLPMDLQWVFVTATLSEAAKQEISSFEAMLAIGKGDKKRRAEPEVVWHRGPGLHKISLNCEHVLVDCTPDKLYTLDSGEKLDAVMRQKCLALAWHLKNGVLKEESENRVVVFCNTVENCSLVEKTLRRINSVDPRTGKFRWKVLELHGSKSRQDYQKNVEAFQSDNVSAADFFKKRIIVCTDRLSRGMDFAAQQVNWVVLMDWPRDATEYIRRAGRTARGGSHGGVLSFVCGNKELKMGKQITSAAIRNLKLASDAEELEERVGCLERFDPTSPEWRDKAARAPKPIYGPRKRQAEEQPPLGLAMPSEADEEIDEELTEQELREMFEEEDMGPYRPFDDDKADKAKYEEADRGWAPWEDDDDDEEEFEGDPWDDDYVDYGFGPAKGGRQGIGLDD